MVNNLNSDNRFFHIPTAKISVDVYRSGRFLLLKYYDGNKIHIAYLGI